MWFLKDIPLEVRRLIYISYLQDATIVWHMPDCNCKRWQYRRGKNIDAWKLLLSCRQILEEAELLAYQHARSVRASCIWKGFGPKLTHAWLKINRLFLNDPVLGTYTKRNGKQVPWFGLWEPLSEAIALGNLRYLEFDQTLYAGTDIDTLGLRSVIHLCKAKNLTSKFGVMTTYQNDTGRFCHLHAFITITNCHSITVSIRHGLPQATTRFEQVFRYCYGDYHWRKTNFKIETNHDEIHSEEEAGMPTSEIILLYPQETYKWLKPESEKNGYTTRWSNGSKSVTVSQTGQITGYPWVVRVPVS